MNLSRLVGSKIRQTDHAAFSGTVTKIGIGSVALGIAVLIVSFSILKGFKDAIKEKLFSYAGNVQIVKISAENNIQDHSFSFDAKPWHSSIKNAEMAQISAKMVGLARYKNEQSGIVLKGTKLIKGQLLFKKNLVSGRWFQNDSAEVVISSKLSNELQIGIHQKLKVFVPPKLRALKVVGIYETGLEEIDQSIVFTELGWLQKTLDWEANQIGQLEIFIPNLSQKDIQMLIKTASFDLGVYKTENTYPQIFDWLKIIDRNADILLSLIILVVGFNMMSVLFVLVMERTQMIGLLQTLGLKYTILKSIFFNLGSHILVRGLLIGNTIGFLTCIIQYYTHVLPLNPKNYFIDHVPIAMNWPAYIVINVLIILSVVTAFIWPLRRASKLVLVDALKFS